MQDSEAFKPSGVNAEEVKLSVDRALEVISQSEEIDPNTKQKLQEFLLEANAELASDTPSWRKIVGALVIVSTILGGLAVAPEALANVNSAVRYILGTSVEILEKKPKEAPAFLPPTVEI